MTTNNDDARTVSVTDDARGKAINDTVGKLLGQAVALLLTHGVSDFEMIAEKVDGNSIRTSAILSASGRLAVTINTMLPTQEQLEASNE